MDTKALRQRILDLAIHGKLVPQDPNDEPAAVLLKRINPKAEISSDNELYGKVPEGWCVTKVKYVFVINPKNKIDEDIDAGFVPMTNISDGFSNKFSYEKKKWKSIKSGFTHFADGDIAVAKISPCLENRKSMVLDNLPNGIGAGTTELHVFRPLLCLTQLYGLYFFKSDYFINQCVGTFNGVVGQQRVGKSIVEDISIPLPPLPEQRRIVSKIESLFSLISLIETGKSNLQSAVKQAKSKILDLAIHGKLVPQDPNDEPAAVLLKRINPKAEISSDNELYEVPDSWVWTTLGEMCIFLSRGKSPKYKDEDRIYPVFAQKCNLKDGGISLEQARFLDPATVEKWGEEYKLKTGDVLINSTGTGTVGRTRLFSESCLGSYPFVVPDSHVSVVRTHNGINSEFVFYYISSSISQQYLEDNLAGSTNQKELYIGVLGDMRFPLPPLPEQRRIVAKIEELFSQLDLIEASL